VTELLEYEVVEDRHPGAWRVEAIGTDGEVYQTVFYGPLAEQRAQQYQRRMASQRWWAFAIASMRS
jgi:hypothetical protein